MSLWQKIILNRVFAVARQIIYEQIFSVYTIFLTRLEHSNFNTCKIFVKFYDVLSNNDRKPTFCSTTSSYSLGRRQNRTNSQHVENVPYNMSLVVRKPVIGVSDQV